MCQANENLTLPNRSTSDSAAQGKEYEAAMKQKKLKGFPPKDVVWDIDDLSKQPPWKDNISGDITNLSDYFVTSDGEDFITLFFRALQKAEELGEPLKIETL